MLDTPFATSAFGAHSVVATIDVINGIVSGVSKPFIAKVSFSLSPLLIMELIIDGGPLVPTWCTYFFGSVLYCRCYPRCLRSEYHDRLCGSGHLHPR
jgi:hypothetical protein